MAKSTKPKEKVVKEVELDAKVESNEVDNLEERISSFGWDTRVIDGHDKYKISAELDNIGKKPLCLILDTIKGKGVSFMEDPSWHCKVPTDEEYEIAMKELGV